MSLYPVSNYNIGTGTASEVLDSISSPDGSLVVTFSNGYATFTNPITGTITNVNLTIDNTTSGSFYLPYSKGASGSQALYTDSNLLFNPSTDTLYATNFNGLASTAQVANQVNPQATPTTTVKYLTFVENTGSAYDLLVDKTLPLTYTPSTGCINTSQVELKGTSGRLRIYERVASPIDYWDIYNTSTNYLYFDNSSGSATPSMYLSQNGGLVLQGTGAGVFLKTRTAGNTNDFELYTTGATGSSFMYWNSTNLGNQMYLSDTGYLTIDSAGAELRLAFQDAGGSFQLYATAGALTFKNSTLTNPSFYLNGYGWLQLKGTQARIELNSKTAGSADYYYLETSGATAGADLLFQYYNGTTTSNTLRLQNDGLLWIGATGSTGAGIRLEDRTTANYWQMYSTGNVLTFDYTTATRFSCNNTGLLTLDGTTAGVQIDSRTAASTDYWTMLSTGATAAALLRFSYFNGSTSTTINPFDVSNTGELRLGTTANNLTNIVMYGTGGVSYLRGNNATYGTHYLADGVVGMTTTYTASTGVGININGINTTLGVWDFVYGSTQSAATLYCQNNTTNPANFQMYHITSMGTTGNFYGCYYNGTFIGGIRQNGASNVSFPSSSDRRLKDEIEDLNETEIGEIIDALKPRKFRWKADNKLTKGFIADELQEVLPDCVFGESGKINDKGEPDYQMADTSSPEMIAVLVAELQFLRKRVLKLENFISQIELI